MVLRGFEKAGCLFENFSSASKSASACECKQFGGSGLLCSSSARGSRYEDPGSEAMDERLEEGAEWTE